jgi:hypothetical protein
VPAHRPFLYVLNLVRTKHIPGVKRGARTKAMAICSQNQHVHIFKPLLLLALDAFFEKPEERFDFFKILSLLFLTSQMISSIPQGVFNAINAMDFNSFPLLSHQEKRIIRAAEKNKDEKRFETKKF